MKKIILANWKMNLPSGGMQAFASKFSPEQKSQIIIAPPFPFLSHMRSLGFAIAAQDVSSNERGAFTGEVSAELLAQVGVHHCIVGHSERRQNHNETHSLLAQKIIQLVNNHITPIFCIGEHHGEQPLADTHAILSAQLAALNSFKGHDIIVAYEPVWAIGSGLSATPDHIKKIHQYIKQRIGPETKILYGGSVSVANAGELLAMDEVDGLLIGGASLKAEDLLNIIGSKLGSAKR